MAVWELSILSEFFLILNLFFKKRNTEGQQTHEKMHNIAHHERNANQNYTKASSHNGQNGRLPCPWDSPGKNTGVGCHFLLQCMKVKRESEVAQSSLTLSDPMDRSLPRSSIHGIFQARLLEWVAIAFSIQWNISHKKE